MIVAETGPDPDLWIDPPTLPHPAPAVEQAPEPRPRGEVWGEVERSDDFRRLHRGLVRFIVPATAVFVAWLLLYTMLGIWARDLMATRVFGAVNVAVLLAVSQFPTTFAITMAYTRYARRRLDPLADDVRARIEEAAP